MSNESRSETVDAYSFGVREWEKISLRNSCKLMKMNANNQTWFIHIASRIFHCAQRAPLHGLAFYIFATI